MGGCFNHFDEEYWKEMLKEMLYYEVIDPFYNPYEPLIAYPDPLFTPTDYYTDAPLVDFIETYTSVDSDIIGEINFNTDNIERYRWSAPIKNKKSKQKRKW